MRLMVMAPAHMHQFVVFGGANGPASIFRYIRATPRCVTIGLGQFFVENVTVVDELGIFLLAADKLHLAYGGERGENIQFGNPIGVWSGWREGVGWVVCFFHYCSAGLGLCTHVEVKLIECCGCGMAVIIIFFFGLGLTNNSAFLKDARKID